VRTRIYCAEALWRWGFHIKPELEREGKALLDQLTEDPQLGAEARQHQWVVDQALGT
jgi:hypothetical protein